MCVNNTMTLIYVCPYSTKLHVYDTRYMEYAVDRVTAAAVAVAAATASKQ